MIENACEKIFLIILAGGKTDEETLRHTGASIKSLLVYKARTLGDIALDAALQTQKYFVVQNPKIEMYGNETLLNKHFYGRIQDAVGSAKIISMPDKAELFDVFEKAIRDKDDNDRIVFIASDLPFLASDSIINLVKESQDQAGIYYPTINEENVPICLRKMKTFKKLNGVRYTGGNVITGKTIDFKMALKYAKKLIAHRKNPLKMVQIFGLKASFGLLSGIWGPKKLAAQITIKTGITLRPYIADDWRLAIDVDGWEDLQILEGSKITKK